MHFLDGSHAERLSQTALRRPRVGHTYFSPGLLQICKMQTCWTSVHIKATDSHYKFVGSYNCIPCLRCEAATRETSQLFIASKTRPSTERNNNGNL